MLYTLVHRRAAAETAVTRAGLSYDRKLAYVPQSPLNGLCYSELSVLWVRLASAVGTSALLD